MKIVWDEPKRQSNLATHGFDLADAELLDWDDVVVLPGHPAKDGRSRFRAIGVLDDESCDGRVLSTRNRSDLGDQHAAVQQ